MAVPDTTTFTLQDVQTELGGVNDDLIECFANADSVQFDSNYEGSKNSLYNFRNYGTVIVDTEAPSVPQNVWIDGSYNPV